MNIAIVNDSPLAVEVIRRVLATEPRHRVIWTAPDGAQAVEQCRTSPPDLVLMDLLMPVVDGVEATCLIMQEQPCAILIVTGSVGTNCGRVFEAMGMGALDVVATPPLHDEAGKLALLEKINRIEQLVSAPTQSARPATKTGVVLLGSSAGGPAALADILAALPPDLPAGVVIVQHVDERFAAELALWLNTRSALPVRAAVEGSIVAPGEVLLAVEADHLVFRRDGSLGYTPHPTSTPYRPSVDCLFESALAGWTNPLVAALLTGMGRDGATGLKRLRDAGRFTIAQDEATSALYGMPRAAAQLGAATEILPLHRIARRIIEKISSSP